MTIQMNESASLIVARPARNVPSNGKSTPMKQQRKSSKLSFGTFPFLAFPSTLFYLFPDEKQLLRAYFASNFKLGSSTDPPTPWELILSKCPMLLTCSLQIRKSHFSQTIHTLFPAAQITKTTISVIVCFWFLKSTPVSPCLSHNLIS
jgi:hypothetical protein